MKIAYLSTMKLAGTVNFENSLARLGYHSTPGLEVVVLGQGEEFKGWRYRMQKYVDFCESVDPNEIVMLTDADDVIFCNDAQELENVFRRFQKPVVITAQPGPNLHNIQCYPALNYISEYPESAPFEINGGGVMGYAAALAEVYRWGLQSGHTDDQRMLGQYVNEHVSLCALDIDAQIFCIISQSYDTDIKWENGRAVSVVRSIRPQIQSRPYLFHFAFYFADDFFLSLWRGKHVDNAVYADITKQVVGPADYVKPHVYSYGFYMASSIFGGILIVSLVLGFLFMILGSTYIHKYRMLRKRHLAESEKKLDESHSIPV